MEFDIKTTPIPSLSSLPYLVGCFEKGRLLLLLEIEEDESSSFNIKEQLLDLLLAKFKEEKEKHLETVKKLLNTASDFPKLKAITLGIIKDGILYLGNRGGGEVLIKRDGKTGKILSSGETSSGQIKAGDLLLFSSSSFVKKVKMEEREKILSLGEVDKGVELGAIALVAMVAEKPKIFKKERRLKEELKDFQVKTLKKIHESWSRVISRLTRRQTLSKESPQEERTKKTLLSLAVILIVLLTSSIFLNIGKSQGEKQKKELASILDLVAHQYDEAVALLDLNPQRSRSLLSDSKLTLSPFISKFSKNSPEGKKIGEWLNKIAEKEVVAYKIYKLTAVPLFFDLNLIKEGGEGERIAGFAELKAILDTKNKAVYSLVTNKKQAAIIAGSEAVDEAKFLAVHGRKVYLLTESGIVNIDIASKSPHEVVKKDEKWGEIGALSTYAGNLYLLDKTSHAIWKYISSEKGYLGRQSYLNLDVRVNFSKALQMEIDGSVWVLLSGGEILKFANGLLAPFAFKGFFEPLPEVTAFSVSDENKNLYLLDRGGQRIVVFDKEGTYFSQYQWDELKNASNIVASEAEKKIFVLSGSKIYAIEIK